MNLKQIKEKFSTINNFFCCKTYKYQKQDFCTIMKQIKSDISIFDAYSAKFAQQIQPFVNEIDVFTSVPKYKTHKYEFDFSKHLAQILSNKLNKPYIENVFEKVKETHKLRTLDYILREKEVLNAFELLYKDTTKKICIVDDVMASGSTLQELVKLLNKNNFSNISLAILILQDYDIK